MTNLRSNFTPGTTRWAVQRAQWLAMGIKEEDFHKPKIAIVNSSSQLSVCYAHLDDVSRVVQQAIRDSGGLPFEIRTAAPSDFITSAGRQGRYLMPTRDLVVNDIEVQVEGAVLDGMLLLSSCDKTTPAHLMAAARLNIPSIIVPCGYQLGGHCSQDPADSESPDSIDVDIETVYCSVGSVRAGTLTIDQLAEMTRHAITGPGVCAGLATANSMHVLAEVLGMALPGTTPIRAGSDRLNSVAAQAGAQIVQLIEQDIKPRHILTTDAFRNALTVAIAIGTSVNVIRHLTATAVEAECDIDVLKTMLELQVELPQITRIRPNGPDRIEAFDAAGGTRGVMLQLVERLAGDVRTVSGASLTDNLAEADQPDEQVIRPLARPFKTEPGLMLIRGSLAPQGAIVKFSAFPEGVYAFSGPARVYADEDRAIDALGNGEVKRGDVVILRLMGPKGGPGTVFAASFMAALVGAGLAPHVAVVTDGELSGLNSGITIGQVMPEAAEGGPLLLVENGDIIVIDVRNFTLNLSVGEETLAARRASMQMELPECPRGWLRQYRTLVQPLSRGAVLSGSASSARIFKDPT